VSENLEANSMFYSSTINLTKTVRTAEVSPAL